MVKKYAAIIVELKAMCAKDQQMRLRTKENPDSWNEIIDHKNTARMKEIIAEIGWPTISKVGMEGSSNAWLLVQHADHDVKFQKKCIQLMKAEPENEVSRKNIAHLEDRIALAENQTQIYGTQFQRDENGQMHPLPIIDPKNVNKRRKKMGLDTLEEYQVRIQLSYGKN